LPLGIDLGTTNSAVAFTADDEVCDFPVAQLCAAGEVGVRPVLPSFTYLPAGPELPAGALALPWDPGRAYAVGELARAQGALVPGRLVASAKSWQCHAGVDRQAAILPWGASPEVPRLSPVEAQAHYLQHIREAWDAAHPEARLELHDVVLTVPASFDEVARELTVEAAHRAGLTRLTLLEEPLAAFYAWLSRSRTLPPDGLILVCDVGGGTTDFTLIRAEAGALDRVAVGDHLLLGGDNMDLALARRVEARLAGRLDARQLAQLVHQCRLAKEQLLGDAARDSATVVVAGRGTRLVGGALSAELTRAEVLETVLEGFFPEVAAGEEPARGRAALYEFGLPYASDPAVTRHLAAFLRRHGGALPDAVLWNGGALKAAPVRERILEVLTRWRGGRTPEVLQSDSLDLAVARGAAYYGLVRLGRGVRVGGGSARAYYVETEVEGGGRAAVCLLPRGAEEGTEVVLPHEFMLIVNRPVRLRLLAASDRSDRTGDVTPLGVPTAVFAASERSERSQASAGSAELASVFAELPPIFTVLRLEGTSRDQMMPIQLHARLTELGTIELHCQARESGRRWRLAFDLRAMEQPAPSADSGSAPEAAPPTPADYPAAIELVRRTFKPESDAEKLPPDRLVKELEQAVGAARDEWSLAALRALWEPLRDLRGERGRTATHEARWLNLAGFCLRPGFGYALDDWRLKELWRVWNAGMVNDGNEAVRLSWWILWRRVSGGLSRTQQDEVAKRIAPQFLAAPGTRPGGRKPPGPQEAAEMWRTVGSLERIPVETKVQLGEAMLDRIEREKREKIGVAGWFAMGRLGARVPLYGPAGNVVPRRAAEKWVERLIALDWRGVEEHAAFALAEIARCAGDRVRDLEEALRVRVAARVRSAAGGDRLADLVLAPVVLEAREEKFAFGDSLPVGLRLAATPAAADDAAPAPPSP
jgi:molecular chaperone DnaK (HSP70)